MNIKIEELLSALNRKEEEKEKNTVSHLLYIISLLRIIWKILKRILMMTSTIISKMKKNNYL